MMSNDFWRCLTPHVGLKLKLPKYHFNKKLWNRENSEQLITEFNNNNETALQGESMLNEKLVEEASGILRKHLDHLKDTESKSDQIDAIESAQKIIDKMANKKVISKNSAGRQKSRLNKSIKSIK